MNLRDKRGTNTDCCVAACPHFSIEIFGLRRAQEGACSHGLINALVELLAVYQVFELQCFD